MLTFSNCQSIVKQPQNTQLYLLEHERDILRSTCLEWQKNKYLPILSQLDGLK